MHLILLSGQAGLELATDHESHVDERRLPLGRLLDAGDDLHEPRSPASGQARVGPHQRSAQQQQTQRGWCELKSLVAFHLLAFEV